MGAFCVDMPTLLLVIVGDNALVRLNTVLRVWSTLANHPITTYYLQLLRHNNIVQVITSTDYL